MDMLVAVVAVTELAVGKVGFSWTVQVSRRVRIYRVKVPTEMLVDPGHDVGVILRERSMRMEDAWSCESARKQSSEDDS